jgi:WD40 repeat protein
LAFIIKLRGPRMPATTCDRLALRFFSLVTAGVLFLISPSAPGADERAETALKDIADRAADPKADREKLRQDLLSFRRVHFRPPESVRAAELLSQLPSPLDKLDPATIPSLDRFEWQPKELVAVLGEHRGRYGYPVSCVAYSPDGKTIASGGNSLIRLWDTATLRQRGALAHGGAVTSMVYTRDGKTLAAAGSDATVRLWEMSSDPPKPGAVITAGTGVLSCVALTPTGRLLATGGQDMLVRLYDLSGDKPKDKGLLGGHSRGISAVAFGPDGKTLATGGLDGMVRVWDVSGETPKEQAVLEGHEKGVLALTFSPVVPPLTLATSGYDGIRLWDLSGLRPRERALLKEHGSYVGALAFTASGRTLASGGGDFNVRLWDVATAREKAILEGHTSVVTGVAFSADGRALATSCSDWVVRLWDLTGTKPKQRFEPKGHLSHPYALTFTPDGQTLASGSEDRTTRLWGLGGRDAKERALLKGDSVAIYALAMSPEGKMLAAGGAGATARVWDPVLGRPLHKLQDAPSSIASLSFTPDGRRLVGGSGKVVCVWDPATGREEVRFEGPTTYVNTLAVSPDGRQVLTSSGGYKYDKNGQIVYKNGAPVFVDCALWFWDLEKGEVLHHLMDFTRPINVAEFTAAGDSALVAAGDPELRFWDLAGSAPRDTQRKFQGTSGYFYAARVSPDSKTVATVGPDAALIVWDLASGKRLFQWQAPENLAGLAFASDSRHLAVGLGTGPLYILRLRELKKATE